MYILSIRQGVPLGRWGSTKTASLLETAKISRWVLGLSVTAGWDTLEFMLDSCFIPCHKCTSSHCCVAYQETDIFALLRKRMYFEPSVAFTGKKSITVRLWSPYASKIQWHPYWNQNSFSELQLIPGCIERGRRATSFEILSVGLTLKIRSIQERKDSWQGSFLGMCTNTQKAFQGSWIARLETHKSQLTCAFQSPKHILIARHLFIQLFLWMPGQDHESLG